MGKRVKTQKLASKLTVTARISREEEPVPYRQERERDRRRGAERVAERARRVERLLVVVAGAR